MGPIFKGPDCTAAGVVLLIFFGLLRLVVGLVLAASFLVLDDLLGVLSAFLGLMEVAAFFGCCSVVIAEFFEMISLSRLGVGPTSVSFALRLFLLSAGVDSGVRFVAL